METQKRRFLCGTLMIKSGLWWCYSNVHIEAWVTIVFPDPPIFPCPRPARRHINVTTVLEASLPVICQFCVPETVWLMLQFNTFSLDRAVQIFSYLVSCCRLDKNRVQSKFTTYINPSIICDDSRFKYGCGLKIFVWPCKKRISKVAHLKMIHLSSAGKTITSIKSSAMIRSIV